MKTDATPSRARRRSAAALSPPLVVCPPIELVGESTVPAAQVADELSGPFLPPLMRSLDEKSDVQEQNRERRHRKRW